jgi:hypothetical protein
VQNEIRPELSTTKKNVQSLIKYPPVDSRFVLNGRLRLPHRIARRRSAIEEGQQLEEALRHVRGPNVGLTSMDRAAINVLPYLGTHPSRSRINLVAELGSNMMTAIHRDYNGNPLMMIAYLIEEFAPTSAVTYASVLQSSVFPALKQHAPWRNAMRQLYIYAAENPPTGGAVPATVEQVRHLIGDMTLPEQRCIYQLWVTASRFGESIGNTDPESASEEDHTPRTWEVRRHPKESVIELHLATSKANVKGGHPYSKWIRLGTNPRVSARYWEPHHVQYWHMLEYIKSLEPTLSLHSFRKGAIRFLESCGIYPASAIALLSGHAESGRFQSLNRSYLAGNPCQQEALEVMKLTTHLRLALGLRE